MWAVFVSSADEIETNLLLMCVNGDEPSASVDASWREFNLLTCAMCQIITGHAVKRSFMSPSERIAPTVFRVDFNYCETLV